MRRRRSAALVGALAAACAAPWPPPAGSGDLGPASAARGANAWGARGLAGQEPPAPPPSDTAATYRLEELVVRVTRSLASLLRLPRAVTALEGEELRAGERGISVAEALRSVPGVLVQERHNASLEERVSIRGSGARAQFGVRGIRVLADGIPLTFPDGQSALTNLDVGTIGRVEVLRGPASALYGNAAGGVLSFRTALPAATPVAGGPRLLAGSHGLLELRGSASGTAGSLGYTATAARFRTDGFREHSEAEVVRGNAVVRGELSSRAALRGILSVYHAPFARNPSSVSLEDARERPRATRPFVISQGAGKRTTQVHAGGALEADPAGLELRTVSWGLRRDVWNPIIGRIIDLGRTGAGLRSELRGGAAGGMLSWTAGADVEAQWDDRRERENVGIPEGGGRAQEGELLLDQRERVVGLGPFAQVTADLGSRWSLTAGARADRYSFRVEDHLLADGDDSGRRTMSRLSPAVGVLYAASPGLALYADFATAFETPTTSELSNRPDGSGGFNPDLRPERVESLEVGAKGALPGARLRFDLAAYRALVRDALVPFQGPTEETFFRNAGRSERLGAEVGAAWEPARGVRAELAYAFQRYRFQTFATETADFSGNREPGVPDHTLFLGLAGRTRFGLRAEANVRWTDAFPVDDANEAWNWSSRVVDVRLSLERGRLRPFLGVDNVLDERWNSSVVPNAFGGRYYEPAPGIAAYGGISLELGPEPPRP